jgi:hypothetical protein
MCSEGSRHWRIALEDGRIKMRPWVNKGGKACNRQGVTCILATGK